MNSLPVILAAGLGIRLGKKYNFKPKCLLEIESKTLIENTIDLLIKNNFKKVIIIIGYKKNLIKKKLSKIENNIQIQYVENKLYNKSGHGLSIFNAIKSLKFKQNILIIHGDLYYDNKIFDLIFKTKVKNFLLVDRKYKIRTKDEMLVTGNKNYVSSIQKYNKNLSNIIGEIVGINLWSKSFQQKYILFCTRYFKKNGFNYNWEKILDEMIKLDKNILIKYKDINNKSWININYEEDIKIAKKIKLSQNNL
ncbi:NTP transferase domain-containing protein [Alphaproteobacteria bacterium]|nr:NTP transferase domain-containing protein [Alphaproteobacteria bacterium]